MAMMTIQDGVPPNILNEWVYSIISNDSYPHPEKFEPLKDFYDDPAIKRLNEAKDQEVYVTALIKFR